MIRSQILVVLLALVATAGCSSTNESPDDLAPPDTTLRGVSEGMNLYIGAAVGTDLQLTDPRYARVLAREFSMVAPENAMKPGPLRPNAQTYAWSDADQLVEFAVANGQAVRGHTLVWHESIPSWMQTANWSNEQVEAMLREHIMTVAGHFKGKLVAWDVVNEAVENDASMRRTFWYTKLGPEYLEKAFRWAHEADPGAKLFYNDYGAEGRGAKSDAVFALVRDLVQKGVPIHGVGLQMHVSASSPVPKADLAWNMARFAALGLEVHITEMDVRIPVPATGAALLQQATAYRNALDACVEQPACTAFVLWGFTDRYSWVPGFFDGMGDALIFDSEYEPKIAYTVMRDGLSQASRGR